MKTLTAFLLLSALPAFAGITLNKPLKPTFAVIESITQDPKVTIGSREEAEGKVQLTIMYHRKLSQKYATLVVNSATTDRFAEPISTHSNGIYNVGILLSPQPLPPMALDANVREEVKILLPIPDVMGFRITPLSN